MITIFSGTSIRVLSPLESFNSFSFSHSIIQSFMGMDEYALHKESKMAQEVEGGVFTFGMAFGYLTTLRYRCISTIIKQIKVRLRTYSSLLLRSQSRDRHESTGLDCCNSLGMTEGVGVLGEGWRKKGR